jgi:hypothetical protein
MPLQLGFIFSVVAVKLVRFIQQISLDLCSVELKYLSAVMNSSILFSLLSQRALSAGIWQSDSSTRR